MPPITLDELLLADKPEQWAKLGFTVSGDTCQLGDVRVRLTGSAADDPPSRGIVGWRLRNIANTDLDGLPTTHSDCSAGAPTAPAAPSTVTATTTAPAVAPTATATATTPHPNGVLSIDHVVAISPALDRSVATLQAAGLDLRRIREQPTPAGAPRQAFFRLGASLLELVQEPDEVIARAGGSDRPAHFWGLALRVADLEHTVRQLGEHVSQIRPAVQPGRQIATLRRSAGLSAPIALMSCPPRAD